MMNYKEAMIDTMGTSSNDNDRIKKEIYIFSANFEKDRYIYIIYYVYNDKDVLWLIILEIRKEKRTYVSFTL